MKPHFLHTRLILDLMRSLVNPRSPLTSRPTVATQAKVRVSPAMHPRYFTSNVIPSATFPISGLGNRLRCWLAYLRLGLQ